MPDTPSPTPDVQAVRAAIATAARGLVDREAVVELIALGAIAGEHALVIGPPGTAKSAAVRRLATALGGRYFEYLLGRFTEPSEIFGPVDLRKLRDGVVETETTNMLPEAELAFLDEVFRGSTAILNTLLGILNERVFRRGHTTARVPLRLCVGAANDLPDDPSLAAFADRFLIHCFVDRVADPQLERLLDEGWRLRTPDKPAADISTIDRLAEAARAVDMEGARPHLAAAIRTLRQHGIELSDRRLVQSQRLIAAAAVLDGRDTATRADLWPLVYAIPTRDQQQAAREHLADVLESSDNETLAAAAEEASLGPLARARRLAAAARELLDNRPAGTAGDGDDGAAWRARLEGIAREIDASFAPSALTDELAAVRAEVVARLTDRSDNDSPLN